MKYRTVELIGSLVLGAVAIAMASKAHAETRTEQCLGFAKYAAQIDERFDAGMTLYDAISAIDEVDLPEGLRRTFSGMAINGYTHHKQVTPAQAFSLTFDVCMRGRK